MTCMNRDWRTGVDRQCSSIGMTRRWKIFVQDPLHQSSVGYVTGGSGRLDVAGEYIQSGKIRM